MSYRKSFKKYLNDLGAKKPSPGGGSAVCLNYCIGLSLIEKAINYSLDKAGRITVGNKKISAEKYLKKLGKMREAVYLYVDLDGKLFSKVMKATPDKRKPLLEESQKLVVNTGKSCLAAFSLAKDVESGIKKSIISDFFIGSELIKVTLFGCIANLKANAAVLGKESSWRKVFEKELKKWR